MLAIITKLDKNKGPLLFTENIQDTFNLLTYEGEINEENKFQFNNILIHKLFGTENGSDKLKECRNEITKLISNSKLEKINDDGFIVTHAFRILILPKFNDLINPISTKYSWKMPSELDESDLDDVKRWANKIMGCKDANIIDTLRMLFDNKINEEEDFIELNGSMKLKGFTDIKIGNISTTITSGPLKIRLKGKYSIKVEHKDNETITEISQE